MQVELEQIAMLDGMEAVTYVNEAGVIIGIYYGAHEPPEGGISVVPQPEVGDQIWLFPGWSESPSRLKAVELAWQTAEMAFIANQLLALEEEAEDALPGTRTQWLAYRTKVRLWHTSVDFPDITKRPVRPTGI